MGDSAPAVPTSVGREGLHRRVASAARWSFTNAIATRLVGLATGLVLARLIVPEQFGVFALALVVFNVAISVSELGASVALIRASGDVDALAPTVTTLALASGTLLGVVCWLVAPSFATAAGTAQAAAPLAILSLCLPLAGLAAVPTALCQREFRQQVRALAEVAGAVTTAGMGVWLGARGWGAEGLAWARVGGLALTTGVFVAMVPTRYRPGFSMPVARDVLRLGLPLAGSSLVVMAVLNLDYLVVSAILGAEQLGFYQLAFNLSSWPVAAFSAPARNVSVAWLSRLRAGAEHDEGLALLLRPLLMLAVPACVLLAVAARPLVEIGYGRTWIPAAGVLTVLAALGAARVFLEVCYDVLVSAGRGGLVLGVHLAWAAVLTPALVVGARSGGIVGVGWGHVVTVVGVIVPLHVWALGRVGVAPRTLWAVVRGPLAFGVVLAIVGAAVGRIGVSSVWIRLLLDAGVTGTVCVILLDVRRGRLRPWAAALCRRLGPRFGQAGSEG